MADIRCCLIMISLVASLAAAAQNPLPVSFDGSDAVPATYFRQAVGPSSLLYTGAEYLRRGSKTIGHPYLLSDQLQPFTIWYKSNRYEQVPALFDIEKDMLVIEDYKKNLLISLIKEGVDSFRAGDRFFQYRMNGDERQFLERLENGPVQLYCLRQKYLAPPARAEENALPFFKEMNTYYLVVEKRLLPVSDEKDIMRQLPSLKEKIRRIIRADNIRIRKNQENGLRQIIAALNQTAG